MSKVVTSHPIKHPVPPPMVRVAGSHRVMGQQIGEAFPHKIQHGIENARKLLEDAYNQLELTWEGAQTQARKYLPFAQERYPQYVEELAGIAEGASVSFEDLVVLNVMEAVTSDALHLTRCTSLAVSGERTSDGRVLVGHNEDWLPEDEDDLFVIHATPDGEPPYLAMTYGGLLANIGFNSHGIAQLCDTVYPDDPRIGIPRVIVSRAVLAARTPSEAIASMLVPHRAAGYNHLLVHESGEMYNVEVSARQFEIIYGRDSCLAHTNHYLTPKMQEIEDEPDELIASRVRYFRTERLLKRVPKHSIGTLKALLADHVNYPNSICNHAIEDEDPLNREKTISSMIFDLSTREMHLTWGNSCENPYTTYRLEV